MKNRGYPNMEVEEQLEQLVEDSPRSLAEAKDIYEEKLEEIREDKTSDAVPEDSFPKFALQRVKSEFSRTDYSTEGETQSVKVVSVGVGGRREWSDGDVYITYGVAQPEDEPAHFTPFIFDEDHVNFDEVRQKFRPMSTLEANVSLAPNKDISDTYIANSTSSTEVEETDSSMSLEERRQWVNENHVTDLVKLDSIKDSLSLTGDHSFAANVGADVKRMQASIVDYFVSDDGETGAYVLQDDSIIDPRDLDQETITADKRSPGLTAWMNDTTMMDYGEDSICDFYGTISAMDSGQIVMNVFGVVPIMANDIDIDPASMTADSSTGGDDPAEETTI